jgi:transposase-like protein
MAIWLIRCGAEKRDIEEAKRFFKQAVYVVGHAPERVTTDGHDSYPRAIRQTLGSDVLHRTNRYLNNRLEPGSPWHQAALLPDAWIRECGLGSTLLSRF